MNARTYTPTLQGPCHNMLPLSNATSELQRVCFPAMACVGLSKPQTIKVQKDHAAHGTSWCLNICSVRTCRCLCLHQAYSGGLMQTPARQHPVPQSSKGPYREPSVGSSARQSCTPLCTAAQPSCNLCCGEACPQQHCKCMHMRLSAVKEEDSGTFCRVLVYFKSRLRAPSTFVSNSVWVAT